MGIFIFLPQQARTLACITSFLHDNPINFILIFLQPIIIIFKLILIGV